jgi:PAS domain S-box-containing protein
MAAKRAAAKKADSDVESLRLRLEEAEETLRAIRGGQVDAILTQGEAGPQVFTLKSADLPYRLLVEAMNEAALIVSPKGVILHANSSLGRFLATPMERLIGSSIDKFAAAEDKRVLAGLLQGAAHGPVQAEVAFLDGQGRRLPSKVSLSMMTMEGSAAMAMVVTDLRTREENREHVAARQRLSFLADASRLLTSTLDPQEMLTVIARLALNGMADWCSIDLKEENGELRRVTIAHRDPEKNAWAADFVRRYPPIDETHASHQAISTGNSIMLANITGEDERVRATIPETREVIAELGLASAMVVPMNARHDTIGAITLVSADPARLYTEADLHMAEALAVRAGLALENSRLYREAQEAVQAREQFLSVASHELRTPLTTLQIQLQHALRKLKRLPLDDATRDLVSMVASADGQSQALVQLVNRLMDLSSIRSGKITLERKRFNLEEALEAVLERCKPHLKHSGTELKTRTRPVHGSWDRVRVEQILTNLISNAIKFGGARPIEISLEGIEGRARITIRDSGIGMAPEFLQRIFKPFEQAKAGGGGQGLGLGLYITHQLVRAHAGTIQVESAPGAGTTFVVELPAEAAGRSTTKSRRLDKAKK